MLVVCYNRSIIKEGVKMKKYLINFTVFAIIFTIIFNPIFTPAIFADEVDLDLGGEGIILVDYDSSRILYERNSTEKLYPASTTKIMTAILAIELGNMDDMVVVDEEVVKLTEGSYIALDYDEEMRFEDLLNGLMIASANDAALAIAKHVSGSIEEFAGLMNAKAKELGAMNTHFVNPNGLHDDEHYTTPYDLFLMARYAMENETFREFASKAQYTIPPTNKKEERILHTTNKFLYGNAQMELDGKLVPIRYEGMKGVKTGTTPEAGSCLVSYAERENKKMISIILKTDQSKIYADTTKLMDYGFNNFSKTILGYSNEFIKNLDVEEGSLPIAPVILKGEVTYLLKTDEDERIEKEIKFKDKIQTPIARGDVLGIAEFYLDGNLIAKENIVSTVDISPVYKSSIFASKSHKTEASQSNSFSIAYVSNILKNNWMIVLIALVIILLIITRSIFVIRKRRKRRRYTKYK